MKYNQIIPPLGKKLFYNWLKQQNLLSNYLANIKRCGSRARLETKPCFYQYINESFCWAKTNEGHGFWSRIQTEWLRYSMWYIRTHSHFRQKFRENRLQ